MAPQPGGEADREQALLLLERLSPFMLRLDELIRRAGPDRVMAALERLDGYLNNPAARFAASMKGGRRG